MTNCHLLQLFHLNSVFLDSQYHFVSSVSPLGFSNDSTLQLLEFHISCVDDNLTIHKIRDLLNS
jgi:hypothetical protein